MDEWTKEALLWPEVWARFRPLTSMGQRAKKSLPPFIPGEEKEWQQALAIQESLYQRAQEDPDWTARIDGALNKLPDIETILLNLEQAGIPGVTDWFRLQEFLRFGNRLRKWIKDCSLERWPDLNLSVWDEAMSLLNPGSGSRIQESFSLERGLDPRLESLTKRKLQLERRLFEETECCATAVEQDYPLLRNRDGEWIVDRAASYIEAMRQDARIERTRETAFEAIFRPLPSLEIVKYMEEVAAVERERAGVTEEVLGRLAEHMLPHVTDLRRVLVAITQLDLDWARMRAAQSWQGVRPTEGDAFVIQGGVHPVMEQRLKGEGRTYTPIDVRVERGMTVLIGPNMGGKTAALRTVGVIASLGQYGFLVPAQDCTMPLVPWVTAVIGDAQDVHAGLSTFGAEVARLASWLGEPKAGLLLLDEIGRGTNPVEGEALSVALTYHLSKGKGWAIHATHYRETIEIKGVRVYRTRGLCQHRELPLEQKPEKARQWLLDGMDFRLVPWQPGDGFPQDALAIATSLGLPSEVIEEARKRVITKTSAEEIPTGGAKPGKGDVRWKTN
ncbi:MutS domain V [Marininema mesophilum]|uniref:MutS domain V n=1 Tax=Marininema mesophilum TaxID=1048340 RepID=A0A1H2T4S6_9BACL|nr:hypothetical protein [Marininema mesophilum]SDW38269.1 MutS domain V [Marininema mesophilum]